MMLKVNTKLKFSNQAFKKIKMAIGLANFNPIKKLTLFPL